MRCECPGASHHAQRNILTMSPRNLAFLAILNLVASICDAAVPTTVLYPFPGTDLKKIRAITMAERIQDSPDLSEAWQVYGELKGSWMPGAHKPREQTVARLDRLKGKLERLKKPNWFSDAMDAPQSGSADLAEKIGDQAFMKQKDSPEYQSLKALAIVYLTEHELDREGSANNAGRFLTVLTITHPWDWELHALYARLLIDAGLADPGWRSATFSIFLNPEPSLDDLKFFAFVGATAAKNQWPEIQKAIRQAAMDDRVAEQVIKESRESYSSAAASTIVPPKNN